VETGNPSACATVRCKWCVSAIALYGLYLSAIKCEGVTQLLINLIIRTRTRLISGVYLHTRHILVSGTGYGVIHATFSCQKLAVRIVLDSSAVVTTVNTRQLVLEVILIFRIIRLKSALHSYSTIRQKLNR
jgi:hypothetical protein